MGFFDWDGGSVISRRSSHHSKHSSSKHKHHHKSSRSKSRSRSRSRTRHASGASAAGIAASIFGGDSSHHKHNSSRGSFFSLPNASRSSFFGFGRPSYYKRSPRPSFMARTWKKLKRLLRDLVYYAKRHPVKVFMLAVLPLITGGALTALLARFGLRMPAGLERMLGVGARAMSGDGIGLVGEAVRMAGGLGGGAASVSMERGRDGGLQWERRRMERDVGGGWGDGLMSNIGKWL
ncbi:hypothetical protein NKR23_g7407 [Pleurostoma richardsiae]|uniref:Uncharacterized protein n=1 Tax=Pleurostoma richardsiae TaxID=41990 RepID=A0AA38RN30_9PEZI|nr:hypothetical protein NKR23_g7407 [Pleurostoma richardsiae]